MISGLLETRVGQKETWVGHGVGTVHDLSEALDMDMDITCSVISSFSVSKILKELP